MSDPEAGLLRLVREALELAVEPVPDPVRGRRLLGLVLPAVARETSRFGTGALRSGLVSAASALLTDPDPGARLADIHRLDNRAARLDWLAGRCLPDAAEVEIRALERLAEADPPVALEGTGARLAAEAHGYADAPLEALLDAHRLIRLFAVVRRLEQDPGTAPVAARRLLGLAEADLQSLPESTLATTGDVDDAPARATLQGWCDLHAVSARAVAGLPALVGGPEVRALAEHLLAGPVALALVEGENRLQLFGLEDLEAQRLVRDGRRSLAARVLAEGRSGTHPTMADAPVIDRQIAARLDGNGLQAVPMYGPDPLGVLLAPAKIDPHRLAVVAVHLAPALAPGVLLAGRLEEQVRRLRGRQERRVREVIHEVNNPLSVVRNYLHVLGSRIDGSPDRRGVARGRRRERARTAAADRRRDQSGRRDPADPGGVSRVGARRHQRRLRPGLAERTGGGRHRSARVGAARGSRRPAGTRPGPCRAGADAGCGKAASDPAESAEERSGGDAGRRRAAAGHPDRGRDRRRQRRRDPHLRHRPRHSPGTAAGAVRSRPVDQGQRPRPGPAHRRPAGGGTGRQHQRRVAPRCRDPLPDPAAVLSQPTALSMLRAMIICWIWLVPS
ncbi:MAG: hypothetical protein U5R48_12055 [Gammaproteobacteria bacterium]|nr:hypothetical protein [Gammaproteobacteria bacterium]